MPKNISEKVVFQNEWMEVLAREVEGEPGAPYFAVRTPDYANVLALTADQHLLLVRQFRPAIGADTLEFSGGGWWMPGKRRNRRRGGNCWRRRGSWPTGLNS